MKEYITFLSEQIQQNVQLLTGVSTITSLYSTEPITIVSNIVPPVVEIEFMFSKNTQRKLCCYFSLEFFKHLANYLYEQEENVSIEYIAKEFMKDILESINLKMNSQNEMFDLDVRNYFVKIIDKNQEIDLEWSSQMSLVEIKFGSHHSLISFVSNILFESRNEYEPLLSTTNTKVNQNENKKYSLKIRVGSVDMSMHAWGMLELEQKIQLKETLNEPIELLLNNVLIAKGELVVIENELGLHLTSVMSVDERIDLLKR